jgi:AraC-like DNA-binding protein
VPLPDCAPRVDLIKWRLPGAWLLSGTFAGVGQISGPASGAPDEVFFGINAAGCSLASQRKRELAIGRHLTDGSLSAAALAARHGITVRYLHKLFEDDAMTYSQYVLDQRLALAYRRLRHPRFTGRTVSSIAHDAGFGDLSYFNRTFRRRYCVTPSDARRRVPDGDAQDDPARIDP